MPTKIEHGAARLAAQRFIRGHFGSEGPKPDIRIPAQPDDDDLLLLAYIDQQSGRDDLLPEAACAAERILKKWGHQGDMIEEVCAEILAIDLPDRKRPSATAKEGR